MSENQKKLVTLFVLFLLSGHCLAQRHHAGLREEVVVLGGGEAPVHCVSRLGREQPKNYF